MSGDHVIYNESGSFQITNEASGDGKRSSVDTVSGKRRKMDNNTLESLKQTFLDMHKAILSRLESIEGNIANVIRRCKRLEEQMEAFTLHCVDKLHDKQKSLPPIGMDNIICSVNSTSDTVTYKESRPALKPNSVLPAPTLNCEEDYPDGSWLGDENDTEARVRCGITPENLFLINASCETPEKLALRLLDFLFDRETQACSNISGLSKHGKKQLDPLLIYGIRSQLKYRFDMSEKEWSHIKKNLDSKCRTAFQRKQRGMPMKVKAFQDPFFQIPYENLHIPNDACASSVTDQQSDSSCNSIITDLPALDKTVKLQETQEPDYQHCNTQSECNAGMSFHLKQEVKIESIASLSEEQHHYISEHVSGSCANEIVTTIETWDHKDATLGCIDDSSFGLLADTAIIDIEHPESQIIRTAIGDVQVVHTIRHQLVSMEIDGKATPSIADVDIIIQSPPKSNVADDNSS